MAVRETDAITVAPAAKVSGSVGLTPYNSFASNWLAAIEPAEPMATPCPIVQRAGQPAIRYSSGMTRSGERGAVASSRA